MKHKKVFVVIFSNRLFSQVILNSTRLINVHILYTGSNLNVLTTELELGEFIINPGLVIIYLFCMVINCID